MAACYTGRWSLPLKVLVLLTILFLVSRGHLNWIQSIYHTNLQKADLVPHDVPMSEMNGRPTEYPKINILQLTKKYSSISNEQTSIPITKTRTYATEIGSTTSASTTSITTAPNPRPLLDKKCDDVCKKLQERFSKWPKGKPKALLYYLVRDHTKITESLNRLYINFLRNFSYPIIIFHEKNLQKEAMNVSLCAHCEIYFQLVSLSAPSVLKDNIPESTPCSKHSVGYRHMCRFHAKTVYELPVFQGFDYAWRLDDDSHILTPISYDVFQCMEKQQYNFGYISTAWESRACILGLLENVTKFVEDNNISPSGLDGWAQNKVYYNNFEISQVSIWKSKQYRSYINYVDAAGGIYFNRWGDAPIKTLAVRLFVTERNIHQFNDIGYSHGNLKVLPTKISLG